MAPGRRKTAVNDGRHRGTAACTCAELKGAILSAYTCPSMKLLPTPLIDDLFAAVRNWNPTPPWLTVASIKADPAAWKAEVEYVVSKPELLGAIVQRHLTPSEANDTAIVTTLDRAQIIGGGGLRVTKPFIAALVHAYLAAIPPDRRERTVTEITSKQSELGMREEWLETAICTLDFSPGFLRDWLLGILPKDGSGSSYWPLVTRLARARPDVALAIALHPGLETAEPGRSLRVKIFSALRNRVTAGLAAAVLEKELARMRDSQSQGERIDFLRTFGTVLWDGILPLGEFEALLAKLDDKPGPERSIGFELANSAVNSDKAAATQKLTAFKWVRRHATPQCSTEEKYNVAHMVWQGGAGLDLQALGFDPLELNLAIQPVAPELKGIWREIAYALQPLLHANPERCRKNIRALAQHHWKPLLKFLSGSRESSWVFGELAQTEWGPAFINELYSSAVEGERRLGRHLFESLQLAAPVEPGSIFTRAEFRLWLAEFQSGTVYKSVATQLQAAARRIDPADQEMVTSFQQEVYLQCINLPGLCLKNLSPLVAELPVLKPTVDSAEAYFKALNELNGSAIKAQQIPGIRRYMVRKARLDRRRLEEEVDRHSVFAQLVSKSYLLYGNQSAWIMDGKLSAPSGLQAFSTSVEYPRLEAIAPEQLHMRRLNALVYLAKVRRQSGVKEDDE